MSLHVLKCWPEEFQAIHDDRKLFEIRVNDKDYHEGDILILHEWDPETQEYTHRVRPLMVTYMLQGKFGLPENLCVMSIVKI
ncbi:MAG: DUF3850 domain-containing protein [Desulfobacterales bacterium]|nr:DUF3850 domain-containing protein [Desulfobacterales bacterium]